jgi:hypothetical protein
MNKLPRLPRRGNVLEAKYTAEQMHEYARKALQEAQAPKPNPMQCYKERCQHGVRWENWCGICNGRATA